MLSFAFPILTRAVWFYYLWKKCGNEESRANSLSNSTKTLKFHGRPSKSKATSYHFWRKIDFQDIFDFSLSHSSSIFAPVSILSEGTGTNHSHHHYVADGCQHGDPQPDGVTGHFSIVLCFGGTRVAGVEIGGGRLQGRVTVIRRIHEGPAHSWEILSGKREMNEGGETPYCLQPTASYLAYYYIELNYGLSHCAIGFSQLIFIMCLDFL